MRNPYTASGGAFHGCRIGGPPPARQRRSWLRGWVLALLIAAMPAAHAGNQKEEALADAVRLALSNAIKDPSPPQPSFRSDADRLRYQAWLATTSARLRRKLPDDQTRNEFLATVWYETRRAGLEPGMVLGLIQVESAYRKYAVSLVGRGC